MRVSIILIGLGLVLGFATSVRAVSPAIKCEAGQLKEAGKLGFCLLKAESKAVKTGADPGADNSKCLTKFDEKLQKIEDRAQGACPASGATHGTTILFAVFDHVAALAAVISGVSCLAGGVEVGGACWFLGELAESCDTVCANAGLSYDAATETYAGSGGTLLQCYAVLDALGQTSPPLEDSGDTNCFLFNVPGLGCIVDSNLRRLRCAVPPTTSSTSLGIAERACACQ